MVSCVDVVDITVIVIIDIPVNLIVFTVMHDVGDGAWWSIGGGADGMIVFAEAVEMAVMPVGAIAIMAWSGDGRGSTETKAVVALSQLSLRKKENSLNAIKEFLISICNCPNVSILCTTAVASLFQKKGLEALKSKLQPAQQRLFLQTRPNTRLLELRADG